MANNINNTSKTDSVEFEVDMWRAVPLSLILTVIDLATIIGNSLVILAVIYDYSLRSMATNFYVVSLAVADLMIGVFVLPFSSTYEILGYWIFGQYFCVIWAMVDVLCCTASILSLVAISLDRYVAISRPMHYAQYSTPRIAGLGIFGVWFLATAISIPPLFGWRSERSDYFQCELTSGKGYVTYSASGSFYIPSIVLVFVYSRIYVVAVKHTKDIKKGQVVGRIRTLDYEVEPGRDIAPVQYRPSTVSSVSQEPFLADHKHRQRETLAKRLKKFTKEKRAAKTLAIVVGAFLICWSPFFFVYLIGGVCDSCHVPEVVFKTFFWLGYCNSFLNPIIYPCLNKDFKRAFSRLFQRTYCTRYGLDYYDSPRRSMRVIRASRKLRMSRPDSHSSSSPPDSPNLALTRRQSIFKEMQSRRASANVSICTSKQNDVDSPNCHRSLADHLRSPESTRRRPSMPVLMLSYSPPLRKATSAQKSYEGETTTTNQLSPHLSESGTSINTKPEGIRPSYPSSYFHSEPNIADDACQDSGLKIFRTNFLGAVNSQDGLNLSLLDIPRVLDGDLSRRSSISNCSKFKSTADFSTCGYSGVGSDGRSSFDASDSYFWDCIAQLRRKSAEARAAHKLGLSRVASCEYELSLQHSNWPTGTRADYHSFHSLSHLNVHLSRKCTVFSTKPSPLHSDKSIQTVLTGDCFHTAKIPLTCKHCDAP